MNWMLFALLTAIASGFLFGTTNWPWWACICAGVLFVWIASLLYIDKQYHQQ